MAATEQRSHVAAVRREQTYLPAVDGLRTVAVLLVVIFHAEKTWLPGGFIGVDVFFVISGFLITRNIMADIERGVWSFSSFYLRRMARLFPALYATIAGTLIAAFFILSPPDLERLGQIAVSTVLSVSNIVFWLESGYFDISAGEKPLLHTWSLAVEEQFYLVWPLLIVLLFAFRRRMAVIVGLGIIGILSFLSAIIWQAQAAEAVFFLTPFRAYQFALGGLIGLLPRLQADGFRGTAGLLALSAIVTLGFLVDGGETGHFLAATIPALAAATVIAAAQTRQMITILGNPAMVWIGKRSYSIYLVHWPLMVLWAFKTESPFTGQSLAMCALSIVLGSVLHAVVETRYRFRPTFDARRKMAVIAGTAIAAMAIVVTGAQFWVKEGYPGRIPKEVAELANLTDQWSTRQIALRTGRCNLVDDFAPADFDQSLCAEADPDRPSYIVIGDSFASDVYLVFSKAFPDVQILQLTIPGCTLRLPERFAGHHSTACRTLYRRFFDDIVKQPGLDGVIMSSNWLSDQYDYVGEILDALEHMDARTILVGQHIRFKRRLPSIVLSSFSIGEAKDRARKALLKGPMRTNNELRERFSDRATFFDFIALQCTDGCDAIRDDVGLMYLDDSHLSLAGSAHLAKRLAAQQPDLLQASTHPARRLEAAYEGPSPARP